MKKLLLTLPIILFVAAACTKTSNTAYQNSDAVQNNVSNQKPVANIESSNQPASVVQNNGLITYRSYKYAYTISFPASWKYDDEADLHINDSKISIELMPNFDYSTNKDLLTYLTQNGRPAGDIGLGFSCPCEKTSINGVPVYKLANHGGEGPLGPGYVFDRGSGNAIFIFVYGNQETDTVNKIIASIKTQ